MFMMDSEWEVVSRKGHQTGSVQQKGPSALTGFRKSEVAMGGRVDYHGPSMEAGAWLAGGREARDSGSTEPSAMLGCA